MPRPKLKRIAREDMPAALRSAFDRSLELRGDGTFFEVFANHPDLYTWYTESFYGEVFRGGLVDRRIKELLRFRLSTVHGCRFCNQGNRLDALDAGLSDADLDAIVDDDLGHFSGHERAAIQLADQMLLTNPTGNLSDETYATLSPHFSDAEILELGLVLGILAGVAKFLFAFDLVEREDNCPIPTGVDPA